MPEPILFIARQKVKQGKAEEHKKAYQESRGWSLGQKITLKTQSAGGYIRLENGGRKKLALTAGG